MANNPSSFYVIGFDVAEISENNPDDLEGLDAAAAHIANLLSTEPSDGNFCPAVSNILLLGSDASAAHIANLVLTIYLIPNSKAWYWRIQYGGCYRALLSYLFCCWGICKWELIPNQFEGSGRS